MNSTMRCGISFCLPVYNVSEYIEECIESIISQNIDDIGYEIVCVDDCSSDNSFEMLISLKEKYPCIVAVKNEKNLGVSATRNVALKHAKGKYIWFVDPDDIIVQESARYLYNGIEPLNADVFIADFTKVPENAKKADYSISVSENLQISEFDIGANLSEVGMRSVCRGLFRKEFLTSNNLKFRENIKFQEDTMFYYEFAQKSVKMLKSDGVVYLYRQRSSSAIHHRSDERTKAYYQSMLALLNAYQEHYSSGEYKNKQELEQIIHQSKEKVAQLLSMVQDKKYIKEQLKYLREQDIYPYPLRFDVLRANVGVPMRIALFVLPILPMFWLVHTVTKRYY